MVLLLFVAAVVAVIVAVTRAINWKRSNLMKLITEEITTILKLFASSGYKRFKRTSMAR